MSLHYTLHTLYYNPLNIYTLPCSSVISLKSTKLSPLTYSSTSFSQLILGLALPLSPSAFLILFICQPSFVHTLPMIRLNLGVFLASVELVKVSIGVMEKYFYYFLFLLFVDPLVKEHFFIDIDSHVLFSILIYVFIY